MTKCPACNSDLVTVMDLGDSVQDSPQQTYNAICGKCSNRFVSDVCYDRDMEKNILTKQQIEDLLTRCKGHWPGEWKATYAGINLGEPDQEITGYGIYNGDSAGEWFIEASNDSYDFGPETWPTMQLAAAAPALLETVQQLQSQQEMLVNALEVARKEIVHRMGGNRALVEASVTIYGIDAALASVKGEGE